jgi:hypothetical protein
VLEPQQRLGSQVPAKFVVEAEATVREPAHLAVHDDERRFLVVVIHQEFVRQGFHVDDECVAITAYQEPDGLALLCLVTVASGHHHELPRGLERAFNGAEHGAEERAMQFGDQHTHGVGAAGGQGLRDGVGLVTQLFHGGQDLLPGFFADLGARIDDARHGCERNPGEFRHFVNVGHRSLLPCYSAGQYCSIYAPLYPQAS